MNQVFDHKGNLITPTPDGTIAEPSVVYNPIVEYPTIGSYLADRGYNTNGLPYANYAIDPNAKVGNNYTYVVKDGITVPTANLDPNQVYAIGNKPNSLQMLGNWFRNKRQAFNNTQAGQNIQAMSFGDKLNTTLGTVGNVLNAYTGYKQYKEGKKQNEYARMHTDRNWEANKRNLNSKLEDRQNRRIEQAKVNGYADKITTVGDYMRQYGVQ